MYVLCVFITYAFTMCVYECVRTCVCVWVWVLLVHGCVFMCWWCVGGCACDVGVWVCLCVDGGVWLCVCVLVVVCRCAFVCW